MLTEAGLATDPPQSQEMATFEDWYKSVPLVTRTYMTLCCLTTLAVQLEFVSPLQLYLNFNAIWQHYQVGHASVQ